MRKSRGQSLMTSATFASAGAVAAKSIDVLIVGERVAAVLSVLLLIWEKVKFLLLNCLTCSLGFFNAERHHKNIRFHCCPKYLGTLNPFLISSRRKNPHFSRQTYIEHIATSDGVSIGEGS